VFLWVVLRVKRFNLTIGAINSKYIGTVQILEIFHNIKFVLKNYLLFFIKILFAVFNVLFVGYSLTKNNLNNTYQYNMTPKNFSKAT
jgi:hypothetical protein